MKRFLNRTKSLLYHLIAYSIVILPAKKKIKHEVIIIRTDGIGDFVMWAGAISAIRNHFENKKITYICPSNYLTLVNALGLFDEVIPLDKGKLESSICHLSKELWILKQIEADIVINPVRSRISPIDYLVGSIGAGEKVGIHPATKKFFHKDRYYTHLYSIPPTCHEMLSSELFIKQVIDASYIHIIADFRKLSDCSSAIVNNKYCVIALSSTDERKIWEIEKVCEVINFVSKDYYVVLTGYGQEDADRANYISSHVDDNSRVIDYVGKTKILDLAVLVSKACFVLGNDSSTVHIAAATRTPSICYMTGATYNHFLPYPSTMGDSYYHPRVVVKIMDCFGCWYKCVKEYKGAGPLKCLDEVTVPMVLKELNKLLIELNLN